MRLSLLLPALALLGACYEPPPAAPPTPDFAAFDAQVYPILLRDCGFPGCHGNGERFFGVYGPLNAFDDELGPDPARDVPATYERARSMLSAATTPAESLLVRKPLELDQGGAPHLGTDAFGRDVFPSTEDARYVAILRWAQGGAP